MQAREDEFKKLQPIITKLITAVANKNTKGKNEFYLELQKIYQKSIDEYKDPAEAKVEAPFPGWLNQKIYDSIFWEIYSGILSSDQSWSAESKDFFLTDYINAVDITGLSKIIKRVEDCIQEFNHAEKYFFMEGRSLRLSDFLDKKQVLYFVMYYCADPEKIDKEQEYKNLFVFFLKLGAHINPDDNPFEKDDPNREPIMMWTPERFLPFVLEHKADPNQHGKGRLPICGFIEKGQRSAVELLLSKGSRHENVDTHGNNVLHIAAGLEATVESSKQSIIDQINSFIASYPRLLATPNNINELPICAAIVDGMIEVVSILIAEHARLGFVIDDENKAEIFKKLITKMKNRFENVEDPDTDSQLNTLKHNLQFLYPLWGMPIDLGALMAEFRNEQFAKYLKAAVRESEKQVNTAVLPRFKDLIDMHEKITSHSLWRFVGEYSTDAPEEPKQANRRGLGSS